MTRPDIDAIEGRWLETTPGSWGICPETDGMEIVSHAVNPWKILGGICNVVPSSTAVNTVHSVATAAIAALKLK